MKNAPAHFFVAVGGCFNLKSMKPYQLFGGCLLTLSTAFIVIQACGTNNDDHSVPIACITSAALPCFFIKIEPQVEAAKLTLKDANDMTTVVNWISGQEIAGYGCIQTDLNGPSLLLPNPGAYQLTVDANNYQSSKISFTMKSG